MKCSTICGAIKSVTVNLTLGAIEVIKQDIHILGVVALEMAFFFAYIFGLVWPLQ